MKFEQLKTAWQADIVATAGGATVDRLVRDVLDADRSYRRQALARRIFGSTAMSLALAMLAIVSWLPGGLWPGMRVAIVIWSLSLAACIAGLWHVRGSRHQRPDKPLLVQLDASLHSVHREMAYFLNLRWLFWLPFGIGFALAVGWGAPNGGVPLSLVLVTAGLWLWGIWRGPRPMLGRLRLQADELERLLVDARSGIDTTNVVPQ